MKQGENKEKEDPPSEWFLNHSSYCEKRRYSNPCPCLALLSLTMSGLYVDTSSTHAGLLSDNAQQIIISTLISHAGIICLITNLI